jgi:hypothetical protein
MVAHEENGKRGAPIRGAIGGAQRLAHVAEGGSGEGAVRSIGVRCMTVKARSDRQARVDATDYLTGLVGNASGG